MLSKGHCGPALYATLWGSWIFIFSFIGILVFWILINSLPIFGEHFDRYPFILLNLFLSCLAAIQAPIILMSQNRQADNDRQVAASDYQTNLKAEIEVHLLHEKIDYLITNQWLHLVQIQQLEIELLHDIQKKQKSQSPPS